MTGSGTLPMGVIYLILLALEGLGVEAPLEVDYLQDGAPAYTIAVAEISAGNRGRYRLEARPIQVRAGIASPAGGSRPGESVPVRLQVEESDLLPHRFLVIVNDSELPELLNTAPLLSGLSSVGSLPIRALGVPADAALAGDGVDLALGSTLTIVRRAGALLVSSTESGIVLLMSEE